MNYTDLAYNAFLERPLGSEAPDGEVSADSVQALMESGTITSDMLAKAIISNDSFKNEIIKNINIESISRSAKAIVTTDNTGTHGNINEAVKYVHDKGGGTVYIKAGKYLINYNVQLYTKIRIVGDGPGETILDFGGSRKYSFNIVGGIDELSLLAGYSKDAYQNIGFENLSFINTGFQSMLTAAAPISLMYVRGAYIRNCFFYDCRGGIIVTNCSPIMIENCVFSQSGTDDSTSNIYVTSGSNITINNCVFNNIHSIGGGGAILFENVSGNTSSCVIQNCLFDNVHTAINITGSLHIKILNNHVSGFTTRGFEITTYEDTNNSYRSIIANNTLVNTAAGTNDAIFIYGVEDDPTIGNIIANNYINNSDNGIYLFIADQTLVSGNIVTGCNTGLLIDSTCDRTLYAGNIIYLNSSNINNTGTNTTASGNITA